MLDGQAVLEWSEASESWLLGVPILHAFTRPRARHGQQHAGGAAACAVRPIGPAQARQGWQCMAASR